MEKGHALLALAAVKTDCRGQGGSKGQLGGPCSDKGEMHMDLTKVVGAMVRTSTVLGRGSICTALGHVIHTLKMFLELTIQLVPLRSCGPGFRGHPPGLSP